MLLNHRKYPRGPFLIMGVFRSEDTSELDQLVYALESDYQLYLQDSGMGWSAAVLSMHEVMRSDWSLREMFDDSNSRAQMIVETKRVMGLLTKQSTIIPLQFPTVCDLMCSIHRVLLRDSPLFDEIYPVLDGRYEFDITIGHFGSENPANDHMSKDIVLFGEKSSKQEQILNLCQSALTQYLVWSEIDEGSADSSHMRKITCLLDDIERTSIETKINQLGAAAGVVGLSLTLSKPRQPSTYLQTFSRRPYLPLQDNLLALPAPAA